MALLFFCYVCVCVLRLYLYLWYVHLVLVVAIATFPAVSHDRRLQCIPASTYAISGRTLAAQTDRLLPLR